VTVPDGFDYWNRQVHFFIRGGMHVTRLVDDVEGPSSNVVDLIQWLILNTSRVPAALLDTPALVAAAQFTDAMGFRFDGVLQESSNLEDFIANSARYFLLTKSKRGGKLGLRPLLPVDDDDLVSTDPVTPEWVFDESRIIPSSFEITYMPLADRKPFCALMLWRQQPEDDIGLVRATEVRYTGTAPDGPFEQHDLSAFCTAEQHAVRVGAYILARRRYVTHTLRVRLRPAEFNPTLAKGDIVQVQMNRAASSSTFGVHSHYYEVDRIGKARNGEVSLDLTHFPVDADGRSLVAQDVMSAVAGGVLLPTGRAPETITCDVNDPEDPTVPPDPGPPEFPDPDFPDPGEPGGPSDPGGPGGPGAPGVPPLPETPPYVPKPPEAFEPPGGGIGIGGGGGGGGGEEEPAPEPGTEPGEDPLDPQEPTPVDVPPPLPIGGSASPGWLGALNDAIRNAPEGVGHGVEWGEFSYSLTVRFSPAGYYKFYGVWSGSSGSSTEGDIGIVETVTFPGISGYTVLRDGYYDGSNVFAAFFRYGMAPEITYGGGIAASGSPLLQIPGFPWGTPGVPNPGGVDDSVLVFPEVEVLDVTRTA
jgi:hypothetical protein